MIARNSSFIYKGKAVHMKQVAEELGVRYVVEGSVRSGDRVRITARTNDVCHRSHLWAERYDRDLADVFAVQDEITEGHRRRDRAAALRRRKIFTPSVSRRTAGCLGSVMRALSHYWRVTRQDNVVAQALLRKRSASILITARRSVCLLPAIHV